MKLLCSNEMTTAYLMYLFDSKQQVKSDGCYLIKIKIKKLKKQCIGFLLIYYIHRHNYIYKLIFYQLFADVTGNVLMPVIIFFQLAELNWVLWGKKFWETVNEAFVVTLWLIIIIWALSSGELDMKTNVQCDRVSS